LHSRNLFSQGGFVKLTGRTLNGDTRITLYRLLPTNGEVLVQRGQIVEPMDVVARAEIPHRYQVINVNRQLGQTEVDAKRAAVMLKAEGDPVEANEAIAVARGRLPFFQRSARSPVAGQIATIGPGWVLVETERTTSEVQAFVHGLVAKVIPQRGVVVETSGALIEAACGFGGEAYGRLRQLVNSPSDIIETDALDESMAGTIIVGGRTVNEELLQQAEARQVRGIIVGSIDAALLNLDPKPQVRVVATEGFGEVAMSRYMFGLLTALLGREISIRGQTSALATPKMRELTMDYPVILATRKLGSNATLAQLPARPEAKDIQVGDRVRVGQGRFLGQIGQIKSIPKEPQITETGLTTSGAYVTLEGAPHYIPWANLEQIS
jgi:hypothetical protein